MDMLKVMVIKTLLVMELDLKFLLAKAQIVQQDLQLLLELHLKLLMQLLMVLEQELELQLLQLQG